MISVMDSCTSRYGIYTMSLLSNVVLMATTHVGMVFLEVLMGTSLNLESRVSEVLFLALWTLSLSLSSLITLPQTVNTSLNRLRIYSCPVTDHVCQTCGGGPEAKTVTYI